MPALGAGGLIADCALLASKRLWVPILTDVVLTTLMHLAVAHRHRLGAQGLSVYFWAQSRHKVGDGVPPPSETGR